MQRAKQKVLNRKPQKQRETRLSTGAIQRQLIIDYEEIYDKTSKKSTDKIWDEYLKMNQEYVPKQLEELKRLEAQKPQLVWKYKLLPRDQVIKFDLEMIDGCYSCIPIKYVLLDKEYCKKFLSSEYGNGEFHQQMLNKTPSESRKDKSLYMNYLTVFSFILVFRHVALAMYPDLIETIPLYLRHNISNDTVKMYSNIIKELDKQQVSQEEESEQEQESDTEEDSVDTLEQEEQQPKIQLQSAKETQVTQEAEEDKNKKDVDDVHPLLKKKYVTFQVQQQTPSDDEADTQMFYERFVKKHKRPVSDTQQQVKEVQKKRKLESSVQHIPTENPPVDTDEEDTVVMETIQASVIKSVVDSVVQTPSVIEKIVQSIVDHHIHKDKSTQYFVTLSDDSKVWQNEDQVPHVLCINYWKNLALNK